MSRILPLESPLPPAIAVRMARLVPGSMNPPALFRAVARNESLFGFLVDSGWLGPTGLLDRRSIEPELREALILRVCTACGNDYEWRLHVGTISARMGLSAAQIEDTRAYVPDPALWSARQHTALALVDALIARRHLEDALHVRLLHMFGEATLLELTLLAGLYAAVAMLVEVIAPDADSYAAALPAVRMAGCVQ